MIGVASELLSLSNGETMIIFDLNGTLTDNSSKEIALKQVAEHLKIPLNKLKLKIKKAKGIAGANYLMIFFLITRDFNKAIILDKVFWKYRIKHIKVKKGAKKLLNNIKKEMPDQTIVVATNGLLDKQIKILKKLRLLKYFSFVASSDIFGSKENAIAYLLNKYKEKAVMIGDTNKDMLAAKKNNIGFIKVKDAIDFDVSYIKKRMK